MENEFTNKVILVTGGTGSIGSELVAQLLEFSPKQIRIFSRDESKQYYLLERLNYPKNLRLLIGDIRDKDRLNLALRGVDIVFHAAAMKHVPLCEYNPYEAVKTNIIGSQNVIDAALENEVKKVIAISTDKAVNPVNILGTSKLMMEKLFTNESYYTANTQTRLSCVRFGNVLWARGSVLPLWEKQADKHKKIKVTDENMTRFFMSKKQAIGLVLKAAQLTQGGEIFIFKMPAIKITDLAKTFIAKYYPGQNIGLEIIGKRPGEKQHEELLDDCNLDRKIYESDELFIVMPFDPEITNQPYKVEESKYFSQGFKKLKTADKCCSLNYIDKKKIQEMI